MGLIHPGYNGICCNQAISERFYFYENTHPDRDLNVNALLTEQGYCNIQQGEEYFLYEFSYFYKTWLVKVKEKSVDEDSQVKTNY